MAHGKNAQRRSNNKEWEGKGRAMNGTSVGSKRYAGSIKQTLHQIERARSKAVALEELELSDTTVKPYLLQGKAVYLTKRQRDGWAESGIDLKEIVKVID